jgi:hypothetical protein
VAEGDVDELLPSGDHGPDQVLVDRERRAYLVDAVLALPERLRAWWSATSTRSARCWRSPRSSA